MFVWFEGITGIPCLRAVAGTWSLWRKNASSEVRRARLLARNKDNYRCKDGKSVG